MSAIAGPSSVPSVPSAEVPAAPAEAGLHDLFSTTETLYLAVISVAALFVAYLGFLAPKRMDESFTWAVLPPLHARFVAALYLFGAVYVGLCAALRNRSAGGPVLGGIVLFTGLLLTVTLLNLPAFDFGLAPVWVWTVSYVVYPLLGLAILAARWNRGTFRVIEREDSEPVPAALRHALRGVALVGGAAGLLLLVDRELMVRSWPWKVTNGLAQFYAAPLLAVAFCAWRYSTRTRLGSLRAFAPALVVLGVGTIVSSIRHRAVFGPADASTIVWYLVFGALTATGLAGTVLSWRRRRPTGAVSRRVNPT